MLTTTAAGSMSRRTRPLADGDRRASADSRGLREPAGVPHQPAQVPALEPDTGACRRPDARSASAAASGQGPPGNQRPGRRRPGRLPAAASSQHGGAGRPGRGGEQGPHLQEGLAHRGAQVLAVRAIPDRAQQDRQPAQGVGVDPSTDTAYVANFDSNTVSVIGVPVTTTTTTTTATTVPYVPPTSVPVAQFTG